MYGLVAAAASLALSLSYSGEIELLFAGDAMMHTAQLEAAKRGSYGYDYNYCFRDVAPYIRTADYAVVNLETPVAKGECSGYPQFNSPVQYVESLAGAGFDLFLTANNHILDRRDRGLKQTISALDSLGLSHIGVYANISSREKEMPFIVEINGFKVGFVNYTYATNGFTVTSDAVVDYINAENIKADIAKARNGGAEIIVAAMHWGEEYTLTPVQSEKQWARFLENEGVDIIIGSHPHVVQPMEFRRNRVTGKPMFLAYSHGNFISNMKTRDTRGGLLTRVTIARDSVGTAYVKSAAYKLIFTIPPTDTSFSPMPTAGMAAVEERYGFVRENYIIVPADSVAAAWRGRAREFVIAAEDAFRKGNIGNIIKD